MRQTTSLVRVERLRVEECRREAGGEREILIHPLIPTTHTQANTHTEREREREREQYPLHTNRQSESANLNFFVS